MYTNSTHLSLSYNVRAQEMHVLGADMWTPCLQVPVEDERLAPRSAPPGYPEVDLFNCMQESHPRVAATIDDFNSARPAR